MIKRTLQKEFVPVMVLCAIMLCITWGAQIIGVGDADVYRLGTSQVAADPGDAAEAEPLLTQKPNLDVMVIAHRGVKMHTPENTLPAIRKAIDMGYDYVELDIRLTKDGVPVVLHDDTVDRTTDGKGPLKDYTLEELRKLDAGSWYNSKKFTGTRVPTLEECLAEMQGKIKLYFDQKEPPTREIIDLLKKYDFYPDNIVVVGCGACQAKFRELEPGAPVMPKLASADQIEQTLKAVPHPFAFNTDCKTLTSDMVVAAHARGVRIFCNSLMVGFPSQERKNMGRAIIMGTDAVQTDRPDVIFPLIEKIKKKALAKNN